MSYVAMSACGGPFGCRCDGPDDFAPDGLVRMADTRLRPPGYVIAQDGTERPYGHVQPMFSIKAEYDSPGWEHTSDAYCFFGEDIEDPQVNVR